MAAMYLGPHVRHPRRRPGPGLPAPRERDRPVAGPPVTASPGTGCTTRWVDHGRREDEQVPGQLAAGHGGGQARATGGAAVTTWPRRTTGRTSSSPRRRWPRPRPATGGIEGFVRRAVERVGTPADAGPRRGRPAAGVRRGDGRRPGRAGSAGRAPRVRLGGQPAARRPDGDDGQLAALWRSVRAMLDVLGVDPLAPTVGGGPQARPTRRTVPLDALVAERLAARQAARAARDFAAADAVRDSLRGAGSSSRTPRPARAGCTGGADGRQLAAARGDPQAGVEEGPGGRLGRPARQRLEGRGPTPKAEDRPGHSAHRRARSAEKQRARGSARATAAPAAGSGARGQGSRRRSPSPGATPCSRRCRRGSPPRRCTSQQYLDADDRVREAMKLAGRAGHPAAGDHARRPRPAQRRGGPPGHRPAGAALPVRRRRRPAGRGLRCRPAAPRRRPRRGDRSAQPRRGRALGGGLRSPRVVIPERRAAGMTASAWKSSAGAASRVPVARATNLCGGWSPHSRPARPSSAWRWPGLELPDLDPAIATGPLVLVVGSEGKGLGHLVSQTCDQLVASRWTPPPSRSTPGRRRASRSTRVAHARRPAGCHATRSRVRRRGRRLDGPEAAASA